MAQNGKQLWDKFLLLWGNSDVLGITPIYIYTQTYNAVCLLNKDEKFALNPICLQKWNEVQASTNSVIKSVIARMYACSVDEWNSCMPLFVSLCCIVMCYRNDEMSEQTRQGFPVWETPRQCKSKGVIDSSIIPHHWPGHPHAPTPLGLYKPATQQHRIKPHTPLYVDTTAWQGIFQIISFHLLAHTVFFLRIKNELFWVRKPR